MAQSVTWRCSKCGATGQEETAWAAGNARDEHDFYAHVD